MKSIKVVRPLYIAQEREFLTDNDEFVEALKKTKCVEVLDIELDDEANVLSKKLNELKGEYDQLLGIFETLKSENQRLTLELEVADATIKKLNETTTDAGGKKDKKPEI